MSKKLIIRRSIIYFILMGLSLTVIRAEDSVPSNPANALGMPSTTLEERLPPPGGDILLSYDSSRRKATKQLDSWKSKDKKSPWPWVVSARLSLNEKKYKQALSQTQKALDHSPTCAEAYYLRGLAYEGLKNFLDAANEFRAALLADSNFPDARDALSRVQVQLGDSSSVSSKSPSN